MSNQVRILLEGGLVQDVQCPDGVEAVVFDYDIEGSTETLSRDNKGIPCFCTTYNREKSYNELQETIETQSEAITHKNNRIDGLLDTIRSQDELMQNMVALREKTVHVMNATISRLTNAIGMKP